MFIIVAAMFTVLTCFALLVPTSSFEVSFMHLPCYLVSLTISLQWAICMQRVGADLSKVKQLLKYAVSCNKPMVTSSDNDDVTNTCDVNLHVLDTAIGAYRTVCDTYRLVNEYYGVHIVCSMTVLIFRELKNPYLIWYCTVTKNAPFAEVCSDFRYNYVILLTVTEFLLITTITAISNSIENKVRILLSFYVPLFYCYILKTY